MSDHRSGKPLSFISLFTGAGGLDLGLERAGLACKAQVEISPFCRDILAQHWPHVPKFSDIKRFRRSDVHGEVDLIVGGFPCQDVSNAGRKIGITGARSGLWSEMLRVVRAFRPSYVLVENVSALRARGLWQVLGDLAKSGFNAEWDCLPASIFGAPHVRDRIFLVAYARRLGWHGPQIFTPLDPPQPAAWPSNQKRRFVEINGRFYRRYPRDLRMAHGLSSAVDRLRACGNAVVPVVGEWIGRRIISCNEQLADMKG